MAQIRFFDTHYISVEQVERGVPLIHQQTGLGWSVLVINKNPYVCVCVCVCVLKNRLITINLTKVCVCVCVCAYIRYLQTYFKLDVINLD